MTEIEYARLELRRAWRFFVQHRTIGGFNALRAAGEYLEWARGR